MNRWKSIIVLVIFTILLLSCAGVPSTPATWDVSPTAIRQVYPDGRYIAQRGSGINREAAEVNAATQIASFFNTQVSYQFEERFREENGNVQSIVDIETVVISYINLFGLRYASDAYYDRRSKQWITVAYIDRNEAWQIYEPRFKRLTESFHQLFQSAENEIDPFRKVLTLIAAQNFIRTSEFQNDEIFGQILYPTRMNETFANMRTQIARLPELLNNARRNVSIFIGCADDFESIITNAFSQKFIEIGFPITRDRDSASAVCTITINEGRQQRELGIFYHPSLQAVISNTTGVLSTFNVEGERVGAVLPDVAKRRAYQSLADKVREDFSL
jgi:hypothetical protein